jgi:hypothetical protein
VLYRSASVLTQRWGFGYGCGNDLASTLIRQVQFDNKALLHTLTTMKKRFALVNRLSAISVHKIRVPLAADRIWDNEEGHVLIDNSVCTGLSREELDMEFVLCEENVGSKRNWSELDSCFGCYRSVWLFVKELTSFGNCHEVVVGEKSACSGKVMEISSSWGTHQVRQRFALPEGPTGSDGDLLCLRDPPGQTPPLVPSPGGGNRSVSEM